MSKITLMLVLLVFIFPYKIKAQEEVEDELFHEIEISYPFWEKENWKADVSASWKHIYDDIGWRRWGGDVSIARKFKLLNFQLGFTSYYTFDKEIANFFEIRPWLGIRSDFELTERFVLTQRFKVENRNFYYSDNYENEHTTRGRFLLALTYNILKERDDWKVNISNEWYFAEKSPDTERFANTIEYGLKIVKVLSNEHEIALGYKLEAYRESKITAKKKDGNIFLLEYRF